MKTFLDLAKKCYLCNVFIIFHSLRVKTSSWNVIIKIAYAVTAFVV